MKRREFVTLIGVGSLFPLELLGQDNQPKYIAKTIPSSGAHIPVIGMGTSRTFNVGASTRLRDVRCEVLARFFEMGGRLIDSSPMYGSSEEVVGYCLKKLGQKDYISATKVWNDDTQAGKEQFQSALKLWGQDHIDIYQVHNLRNWQEHLKVLQQYKAEGKIKYIGITTSHQRRIPDFQDIMKTQDLDFAQFTYNLDERWNEGETLAIAQDRGIATLINRPFARGALFRRVKGEKLPGFASEIGCQNWAQYFLKWVVSHPGVTCAIPATSKVDHMVENMGALVGGLPDQNMRAEMLKYFSSL